jgi:soluble lytic murein transglycosylase-like protein
MNADLIVLAKQIAVDHGLDPVLVCAVVEQESGWLPSAIRYESAFFSKYIVPQYTANKITATEAHARAFSWGLMQLMGQVAREEGFAGHMVDLCQPAIGLDRGCVHLAKKLEEHGGDVTLGLLAWNGGSNQFYPQEVIARLERYR